MADSPDREVSIYLPPDYAKETQQRYPVLYLLHGYTGNDRGWMDPGYVGLPEMMDRLIEHHTIEPMIVVMPNSFNRFARQLLHQFGALGRLGGLSSLRDLVSYIDAHYRTLATLDQPRHCRALHGRLRRAADRHAASRSVQRGLWNESVLCRVGESEVRDDVVKAQRAKNLQEIVAGGMGPQVALALAAAFSPDLHNPPLRRGLAIRCQGPAGAGGDRALEVEPAG